MTSFDEAIRRIEQYRICLERDAELGVAAAGARQRVDDCYRDLESVLRSARVELEAAGAPISEDREFRQQFVRGCSTLALRMFRRMCREEDAHLLGREAGTIRAEARSLIEHLWARLEAPAA